jgi:aminopeptidase N
MIVALALTQPGYPVLQVATAHRGDSLEVTIRQVQPDAWGLCWIPALEVEVDRRTYPVPMELRVTRLTVPKEAAGPAEVRIDPNGKWLLDVKLAGVP